MRIAVDAMGGDHAPREVVLGAVQAARELPTVTEIYLVGDESAIKAELALCGTVPSNVHIRHASQVVEMGEAPALAIRRKRDSSIGRAVDMAFLWPRLRFWPWIFSNSSRCRWLHP